ncbi:MAG: hypothetical protein LC792_20555, partial [Actinobacteria bacterium]|nr:hypothetical protein [Actinomycetota bacterium]
MEDQDMGLKAAGSSGRDPADMAHRRLSSIVGFLPVSGEWLIGWFRARRVLVFRSPRLGGDLAVHAGARDRVERLLPELAQAVHRVYPPAVAAREPVGQSGEGSLRP